MLRWIYLPAFFSVNHPQEKNPASTDISLLRSIGSYYRSLDLGLHPSPLCSAESLDSLLQSIADAISDDESEDDYTFDEYPCADFRFRPPTPAYKKFSTPLKHLDIYSWYYEPDATEEY